MSYYIQVLMKLNDMICNYSLIVDDNDGGDHDDNGDDSESDGGDVSDGSNVDDFYDANDDDDDDNGGDDDDGNGNNNDSDSGINIISIIAAASTSGMLTKIMTINDVDYDDDDDDVLTPAQITTFFHSALRSTPCALIDSMLWHNLHASGLRIRGRTPSLLPRAFLLSKPTPVSTRDTRRLTRRAKSYEKRTASNQPLNSCQKQEPRCRYTKCHMMTRPSSDRENRKGMIVQP
ncbi:hypothetical protein PUN28_006869 [Cardiocondyla obscurior]|uniref:Uncharacterized protein n=1 Tax=Cardiocondyla obscurior TaxID=286306 RepID=A0AAW2G1V0_9HYME